MNCFCIFFFSLQLFEQVRNTRGLEELQKSVTVVNGDVTIVGLGLSPEDKTMLCETIDIVYHAAASVR